MLGLIRYFTRGHGVILLIALGIVGVSWIISKNRDKEQAKAEKKQVQRPLGQVNPKPSVDQSTAPKETILSDRKLSPVTRPEAEATPQDIQVSNPLQRRSLPTLVSFYSQVAAPSPTPTPEEHREPEQIWLPPSIFIPCALVNTVESSHINTPVVAEVIRDVYQNGHLIIPAGTIASSFAQSGAVRDRIEVAGMWLFVFKDGRSLKINGIACDREADPTNQQFGIEDGSAGLQGELVESDHWANAKAFIALLMMSTAQVGTAAANSALSQGFSGGTVLPDTSAITAKYLDQLLNGQTGDGRFVRVNASKEFYIYGTETLFPTHRSVDNKARDKSEEEQLRTQPSSDPMQSMMQMQRQLMKEQQPAQQENNSPNFRY